MRMRTRHSYAWDLTGIRNSEHRKIIWGALNACDFPFVRIRRRTGKRVPCTISDLSRFQQELDSAGAHGHVHSEHHESGHLLGDPARRAALGLFWLPTSGYPAGRVELEIGIMDDVPLAHEVFLAEAAHAVDYGSFTDEQREAVLARFHDTGEQHPHDWFEEAGVEDYWSWSGERWMGLFMAAYAPSLPRPLEVRQPWTHSYDQADIEAVRQILR